MRQFKGPIRSSIEQLDRRALLAATGSVTALGPTTTSIDFGTGGVEITLGPGGRTLVTKVFTDFPVPTDSVRFTLGTQSYSVGGNSREAYQPTFQGFDASGRAIISMLHAFPSANGYVEERHVIEFPANGTAPRTITGLPTLHQRAYNHAIALSPNGGVLGAVLNSQTNTIEFTRLLNGNATTISTYHAYPIQKVVSAAMNDAGDFIVVIDEGTQGQFRIFRHTSTGGAATAFRAPAYTIAVAIDASHGAVTAAGKLWRFALSGPVDVASTQLTGLEIESASVVSRGNGHFLITVLDAPTRSSNRAGIFRTFDSENGLLRQGVQSIPKSEHVGEDRTFSRLSSTIDGRVGVGYVQERFDRNAPEFSYDGFKLLATLDSTPQAYLPELMSQKVWGYFPEVGYGNRPATTTQWGATPSSGDGITSVGRIYFVSAGFPINTPFNVSYFLSLDGTYSADDVPLHSDTITPGQTQLESIDVDGSRNTQVYLPSAIPSGFSATGNYYLIARLDSGSQIIEQDETDNTTAYPFRVEGRANVVSNRVNGRVTNAAGAGVANTRVYRDANFNNRFDAGEQVSITNASGEYVLEFVGLGSTHVSIDGSNFAPAAGHWFNINFAGERYTFNFTLNNAEPVSNRVFGRVTNSAGVAQASVRVYLDRNFNNRFDTGETVALTSSGGEYELLYTGTGSQHVTIDGSNFAPAAGYWFTVTTPGDRRTLNFTIASAPPTVQNRIFGRVANSAGAGQVNVRVYLDRNFNNRFDTGEILALTSGGGEYELLYTGTGSQHLSIDGSNFAPAAGYWFTVTTAGDRRTLNFTIASAPPTVQNRIFGRVANASNAAQGNVRVYLDRNFNNRFDDGELFAYTSASGGEYELLYTGTGGFHLSIEGSNFTPSAGYWFTVFAAGDFRVLNFTMPS